MTGHETLIFHYLADHRHLGYAVVFLAMVLEGDAFLFTAGFLTHEGLFEFWRMTAVVVSGTFFATVVWFQFGRWLRGGTRMPRTRRWVERVAQHFDHHLERRLFHTMFISKFVLGIGRAIIIRAGMLGLGWRRFLISDWTSLLAWVAVVGGLGYASSASYLLVRHYLRFGEFALLVSVILFLLAERYIVDRSLKKQL